MYLSDSFIETYKDKTVPFGGNGLGEFVYLRTYSRWNEEKMRRETWPETCRRVVEYSMKLYSGPANRTHLVADAELMFDKMFHLKAFPAGRTLWVGGTEAAEISPISQFNCSFLTIDEIKKFSELFYVLMLGTGVGFRILKEDVDKLARVNTDVVLANKPYHGKSKPERIERSMVFEEDGNFYIVVGDSREGWVEALNFYFDALQREDVRAILINYDSVRPYGEPLKKFGGRASGHTALRDLFKNIHKVICDGRQGMQALRPIHCLDIANIIGYYVVVGGVRRTSEIALFSPDDEEVLNAKYGLWEEGMPNYGKNWRSMSNNSIFFQQKPSREFLRDLMVSIKHNGEPGFINAEASAMRRPGYAGTNPCAEILLADRGLCNLSEINMVAFVDEAGNIDFAELKDALEVGTRIGMRITNLTLELPEWDAVQKRDRLIGISLDGWEEAAARMKLGGRTDDDIKQVLLQLHQWNMQEVIRYAYEMRIPMPLLSTCVKPSGTLAQLPTISSGVHKSYAPFYIRRVRISSSDPLARVMLDLGFPVYPENGQGPDAKTFNAMSPFDRSDALRKANTWVIEFPVKTSAVTRAHDESALDQFNRYLMFQDVWTEHNTSITIYVGEDEWDGLFDKIYERWDDYIGVSFLPKTDNIYPLMPYEEITEEEYWYRAEKLDTFTNELHERLTELERSNLATDLLDDGCETGICPVR